MFTSDSNPALSAIEGSEIVVNQVRTWLARKGFTIAGPGALNDASGRRVDGGQVHDLWGLARLDGYAQNSPDSVRNLAYAEALRRELADLLRRSLASVAYDSSLEDAANEQARRWVMGATGERNEEMLKLYVAVIKHYIWQIKRKALRLPVTYHMVPLLVGGQGTGKTTAINRLNEPMQSFTIKGKPVDSFTDPREYQTLAQNYIAFLDEMGRANKACIAHLKTIITSDSLEYRKLGTHIYPMIPQNCTFIGASNQDIRDLINDSTGMRRFFQMACSTGAASPESHSLVNSVDISLLWKGVDERRERPYIADFKEAVADNQEELRTKSSVEEYLEYYNGQPGELRVAANKLYASYADFCKANHLYARSMPAFCRDLVVTHGYERRRTNRGSNYGVNEALAKEIGVAAEFSLEKKLV